MRTSRNQQSLSYPPRLPDEAQQDALRLLDVSREVINAVITSLWDRLDEFGTRTHTYAYKQVEEMISSPMPHGHRQWRCEAEQTGRILRGQAERKKQFALIMPLLEEGMIQPKTEKQQAGKKRSAIKQALADLHEANADGGNAVELQSLIEQCCNFYLKNGCFPDTYEEMQAVLGFDWGVRTLVTATAIDLNGHQIGRPFFLDTGCLDGRQARTRRQIDLLKKKAAWLEARRDSLPEGEKRGEPAIRKLGVLRKEIAHCWRKYEARNKDLAHLTANVLLLLATVSGCSFIAGESLKSLKTTGRGRDAKGKWRNWRNNSQVRGELWRVLRYKCHLVGIRLEWQQPRKTSHTCPRCAAPAHTYRSPEHLSKVEDWGAWLICRSCGWNGARDYAASLNIARLGATFITHYLTTSRYSHASIADKAVKPLSYMGSGSALRLPPMVPRNHLLAAGKIYVNGWRKAVKLHSSYVTETMLRLCG